MATDAKQSDPFKMTTVALLIIAVVMALVFSTQAKSRKDQDRKRMHDAGQEVAAVGFFLEDGDLPNAIVALHDIGLRLARVEGAEDAALEVSEAVQAALATHEQTKSELATSRAEVQRLKGTLAETGRRNDRNRSRTVVLETLRDRNALILGNLVSGQFALARRLLDTTPEKDVVARAAERLLGRLDAFNEAAAAVGVERVHGLRALARTWSAPGVVSFAKLVGGEETRRHRAEALSESIRASLDAADAEAARTSLGYLLRAAGVPAVEEYAARLAKLETHRAAAKAEAAGDLALAVAGYRIAGEEADARRLRRLQNRDLLIGLAVMAARERRLLAAGDLFLAAHEVTGDPKLKEASDQHYAEGWLVRAREHLDRARFRAAAAATDRAGLYASEAAGEFLVKVKAEFARFEAAEAAARAREALEAGAAGLAAVILGKHEVPQDLRTDVEIGRKEEVRRNARVALYEKDGKRALSLLASIDDTGPLSARANLWRACLGARKSGRCCCSTRAGPCWRRSPRGPRASVSPPSAPREPAPRRSPCSGRRWTGWGTSLWATSSGTR